MVYGGTPDYYKTRLGWVGSATPADVQGAARRWLSDGVFVVNVVPTPDYKTVASTVDRSKRARRPGRRRHSRCRGRRAPNYRTACRWSWSSGTTRRWSISR